MYVRAERMLYMLRRDIPALSAGIAGCRFSNCFNVISTRKADGLRYHDQLVRQSCAVQKPITLNISGATSTATNNASSIMIL